MYDHLSHAFANPIDLNSRGGGRRIEYPGKLSVYNYFHGCGSHPQFNHLKHPPEGYSFVHSSDGPGRLGLARTLLHMVRLSWRLLLSGISISDTYRFVRSRGLRWQRYMGTTKSECLFFPSVPFHLDQFPWAMEIEDATSMLYPFITNGQTGQLDREQLNRVAPIFRYLLESPNCLAIISHMKSTVDSIPVLLGSEKLAHKIFHIPVGIPIPDWEDVERHKNAKKGGPVILFSNSWHQNAGGFFVRGGLDLLEAFALIRARFPTARLILRTSLPEELPKKYIDLIRELKVEVIEEFLSKEAWHKLRSQADYFIFPSARIHIVSLLEAMAYGMCIITSDGWGIDEYARDDYNAVIVPGRREVAWMDKETGILREDYRGMYESHPELYQRIAAEFFALEADPARKERLVQRARKDVEEVYTVERWNQGLKKVFDSTI